jgi:hypothetical protein
VINTATATANGLTAGTQGGTLVTDSTQTVDPGTNVTSRSYTNSRNVNGVANTASAAANVASLNATSGGGVNARLTQSSGANIRATAEADHCCVRTVTTATAIASANNITGTSNGGTANVTTNQRTRGGSVVALVDLYAGNTGDMAATATANGNAVTYGGAHAPLTMNATQDNTSNVQAEAYATVGGEFTGVVSGSSYGVGNSAVGQNSGANGTFNTDQRNSGRVTSYTAVTGNGGVGATGSSTAIGNMASGFVCTACGPATLTANNRQVNNGAITASTTMVAGQTGTVVASATAIGNAATYTIRSGQ